MTFSRFARRAATAGVCVSVGAAAGIAGSAAAPVKSARTAKPTTVLRTQTIAGLVGPAGVAAVEIGAGGPPVHGVEVVPNKAGDGFDTVTQDSGTVKSVSATALTITEGTGKATYATPTLTIAGAATVERNFEPAQLADVQVGDHVDVSTDSGGTTSVFAADASHWPPKPPSIAGCGKAGALPPLPRGTPGVMSGSVTAATGATGVTGVASATIVKLGTGQAPGGVVACSFSAAP